MSELACGTDRGAQSPLTATERLLPAIPVVQCLGLTDRFQSFPVGRELRGCPMQVQIDATDRFDSEFDRLTGRKVQRCPPFCSRSVPTRQAPTSSASTIAGPCGRPRCNRLAAVPAASAGIRVVRPSRWLLARACAANDELQADPGLERRKLSCNPLHLARSTTATSFTPIGRNHCQ